MQDTPSRFGITRKTIVGELLTDRVTQSPRKLSGLPLGMIAGTSYRQSVVELGSGDFIVLYTDSLIENESPKGEPVGRQRLLEFARQTSTDSPALVGESLARRVRRFSAESARTDDETIVVLRRLDESELSPTIPLVNEFVLGAARASP